MKIYRVKLYRSGVIEVRGTLETTIERECTFMGSDVMREVPLLVEYTYHQGCRGERDSLCGVRGAGPPIEPDEPPYIELDSVTDADSGSEIELTDTESNRIRDECIDRHFDCIGDGPD
jgi:hypothetical protein